MEKNELIPFKESVFEKIKRRIFNFFSGKKNEEIIDEINMETKEEKVEEQSIKNEDKKEFIGDLIIEEDPERRRIMELRRKYDNKEISSKDISLEDMDKIIELYNEDTAKINEDILRRKESIARMLSEMKKEKVTES